MPLPAPDDTLDAWRALAGRPLPSAPDAAPTHEYTRSPAAATVARLAASSGLFHFHFERRHHLAHPAAWVPEHAPDLADPPTWSDGLLPERKYQSFRHDLMIASFHPHHRPKWAAHELCHGLVGFAWRPDATPFFHATAGRLAELLPVALWYFFDEAFLRRCPDHADAGALFQVPCAACEAAAGPLTDDPHARDRVADGLRFLDRELAAVARSRREGRVISHRWATIDLASDGVAYARAHAARLGSETFLRFAERFLPPGAGRSADLDALEARVLAVAAGLLGGPDPAPWAPAPAEGRLRWIVQDLAFRVATIASETEGDAAAALDDALERLAGDPSADGLRALRDAYAAVHADYELPDPEDVFAVGYDAPAADPGARELQAGLASCVPGLLDALGAHAEPLIARFAAADGLERAHVAARFARLVAAAHPGPVAALADWYATLATLPPRPADLLDGPGDGARLAPHAAVRVYDHDVLDLAEALEDGRLDLVWHDGAPRLASHAGDPPAPRPTALVAARDEAGEIVLLDVDPVTAAALATDPERVPRDEQVALRAHGVLVPERLNEVLGRGGDAPPPVVPSPVTG